MEVLVLRDDDEDDDNTFADAFKVASETASKNVTSDSASNKMDVKVLQQELHRLTRKKNAVDVALEPPPVPVRPKIPAGFRLFQEAVKNAEIEWRTSPLKAQLSPTEFTNLSNTVWLLVNELHNLFGFLYCHASLSSHRTSNSRDSVWASLKKPAIADSIRAAVYDHARQKGHQAARESFKTPNKKLVTIEAAMVRGGEMLREKTALGGELTKESMANLLRCANYIAQSLSSFAQFQHLVELLKQAKADTGDTFYSKDACKRLTDLMSKVCNAALVKAVVEGDCLISLMLDESTDVSNRSTVVVHLRSALHGEIDASNYFLKLFEVEKTDAETLCEQTVKVLVDLGLSEAFLKRNLISIASDSAAVMTGQNEGFGARLSRRLFGAEYRIPHIFCKNHQLELCLRRAIKNESHQSIDIH